MIKEDGFDSETARIVVISTTERKDQTYVSWDEHPCVCQFSKANPYQQSGRSINHIRNSTTPPKKECKSIEFESGMICILNSGMKSKIGSDLEMTCPRVFELLPVTSARRAMAS
ncbi:hypothetical protein K3495_g2415 [Podosphaera aphanis]|nr:hypothetical protein K3495_g2415 [Podosphaera aphanis]